MTIMTNQKEVGDTFCKRVVNTSLRLLNEPAYILAFTSIIFYISVHRYYEGFCQILSIPFNSFDLPFTFFVSVGFKFAIMLLILLISILAILILYKGKYLKDVVVSVFLSIVSTYLVSKIILYYQKATDFYSFLILTGSLNTFFQLVILLFAIATATSLLLNLLSEKFLLRNDYVKLFTTRVQSRIESMKIEIKNSIDDLTKMQRRLLILYGIIGLSIILLSIMYVPFIMGSNDARNILEGGDGNLKVTFELKEKNHSLSNKSLILIMFQNSNYYVVENTNISEENVKLYAIPDDQVVTACIETIGNKSAGWMGIV